MRLMTTLPPERLGIWPRQWRRNAIETSASVRERRSTLRSDAGIPAIGLPWRDVVEEHKQSAVLVRTGAQGGILGVVLGEMVRKTGRNVK